MFFDNQPESSFEISQIAHADSFSDQSRHTVAPLVVQAFDQTGLATALAARTMLPGPKQFGIRFVEVGINQLLAVVTGQRKPEVP